MQAWRIKVVVTEAGSDKADALFDQWATEERQLIAPVFFEVETDRILRQKASLRRELTADQAQVLLLHSGHCPFRQSIQQSKENGPGKSLASFNSQPSTTPPI